jgi:hypothetical protein
MAHTTYNAVTNTEALKQIWDSEWGLDPVEETKIADWVAEPVGVTPFGNLLNLRKIPAIAANTYTPSTTAALRAQLVWATATAATVTVSPAGRYFAIGVERAILNRVIDDGNYRSALKKQGMAGLNTAIDVIGFALASSLSSTVSQADIDDAMVRTALGQLATNAGNKFTNEAPKLLVVHPSEYKNALGIAAIKEYQIRGTIGAAVNGTLNAYGVIWRESASVLLSAGSYYNPLLLKDAWALAHNEKPHILDSQFDGLSENFIGYTEVGWAEWFDSSGVALITT